MNPLPKKVYVPALLILLALIVGGGYLCTKTPDYFPIVQPSGNLSVDAQREATRTTAITTTRASLLAVLAGIGALLSVLINGRNSLIASNTLQENARAYAATETDRRRELELREKQLGADEKDALQRRVTDLYTKASELLGSEAPAVRLAGIYALERLAQENFDQRQTVVEVLTSYLRMPLDPRGATDEELASRSDREVRSAAASVLRRHRKYSEMEEATYRDAPQFWEVDALDFRGADLSGFIMGSADWEGADFRNTHLAGTNLQSCKINGGSFHSADLTNAWFFNTNLANCDFREATLRETKFVECSLEGAGLEGVDLRGSMIRYTNLRQARVDDDTHFPSQEPEFLLDLSDLIKDGHSFSVQGTDNGS